MKLELQNVSLRFNNKRSIFSDINLVVTSGDFIVIRGSSGCGKSSLLKIMNGLLSPVTGSVRYNDQDLAACDITRVRRDVAYVQQTPVMLAATVRENLALPFRYRSASDHTCPPAAELRRYLDEFLLTEVDLDDDAFTLSVGQKQRIALLRTTLLKPRILLCDEPTSALDEQSKIVVDNRLESINSDDGIGVVLVTHAVS